MAKDVNPFVIIGRRNPETQKQEAHEKYEKSKFGNKANTLGKNNFRMKNPCDF